MDQSQIDGKRSQLSQTVLGIVAASLAAMIWSSWTVVSKIGVSGELRPQDLAAIRFAISGVCSLPVVLLFGAFHKTSTWRLLSLAATGGVPYVLLLYFGFEFSPASHAGIMVNGLVPGIAIFYRSAETSSWPRLREVLGVLGILLGVTLVVASAAGADKSYLIGDAMFGSAAFLFAGFLSFESKYKAEPAEILLALSVLGAAIYLPIWLAILPSSLNTARHSTIMLEGLYQGLLAPIAGMLLIAQATTRSGPIVTAAVLSSVPGMSALLGFAILGERISSIGWLGLCLATSAILFIIFLKPEQPTTLTAAAIVDPA